MVLGKRAIPWLLVAVLAASGVLLPIAALPTPALPGAGAPSSSSAPHSLPSTDVLGVAHHPGLPMSAAHAGGTKAVSNIYFRHWYAGAQYSGPNRTASQLSVRVQLPDAVPSSTEFYYVLLSAWDSAGSYDQVGFSNDLGVWGWTTSFTTACAGSYNYSANQRALTPGVAYTFGMSLSNGTINFTVAAAGKTIASVTGTTGGTGFLEQPWYSCGGTTWFGYENYEEVYYTVQKVPSFDFTFLHNTANNTRVTAWQRDISANVGERVSLHSGTITVINQPFALAFYLSHDNVSLHRLGSYTANLSLLQVLPTSSLSFNWSGVVRGVSVTFLPTNSSVPGIVQFTVTVGKAAAKGTFELDLVGTGARSLYTYVTLTLTVK
ncbi:MAG: hypothetical protein ACHQ2Y_09945 [Candidatus Lutacidiplasmatales archaeon]